MTRAPADDCLVLGFQIFLQPSVDQNMMCFKIGEVFKFLQGIMDMAGASVESMWTVPLVGIYSDCAKRVQKRAETLSTNKIATPLRGANVASPYKAL